MHVAQKMFSVWQLECEVIYYVRAAVPYSLMPVAQKMFSIW
jgi:hypothetical protein